MARVIIAPGKYVQGKGILKDLAEYVEPVGKNPYVLISENGKKRFGEDISASFEDTDVKFDIFNGECSKNEINRVIDILGDSDVIVGVGGGKIHDTAKAVGFYTDKPVIIIPTVASTDAPCSAVSVIYTDDGAVEEYLWLKSNPNVVLVDTEVITAAPARLLVSGMGDALATYFETRANVRNDGIAPSGGKTTRSALALAELSYELILTKGVEAKIAIENKACTKALEDIIESNTYLSGVGFESGGLAAAHAIHNGLTELKETDEMYHGEIVAFGTICQLILENAPSEELEQVVGVCVQLGLPVTLKELGFKKNLEERVMEVAKIATADHETTHNMYFEVTTQDVYDAIMGADAMGHFFLGD